MRAWWSAALAACLLVQAGQVSARDEKTSRCSAPSALKPRVLVMTDIADDPDDEQSLVRLLVYANEFDIKKLVATTSVYHRGPVHPDLFTDRVHACGAVVVHLRVHAADYPGAATLLGRIHAGGPDYGMAGVGAGKGTTTSDWIIATIDKPDPRPVWFLIWGGAHDLAQAQWKVQATRSPAAFATFLAKVRAYLVSEQDDSGPRLRRTNPGLFWIASVHAAWQYPAVTWTGIAADALFHFEGPDSSVISPAWIDRSVRYGPLGAVYPPVQYTMEGESPTLLYLLPTGLGDPEHPDYGGWGGRYGLPLGNARAYADAEDLVTGSDGKPHLGNPETAWHWRPAVQADIASRMRWTLTSHYADANHPPVPSLNGTIGLSPIRISAHSGEAIAQSALGSCDTDGDALHFRWFSIANQAEAISCPISA